MAKARRVSVNVLVVGAVPPVFGDRERLADAVYHLVHNAIKFNRSGGTVNVSCRSVDGDVVLQVEDTGRGIPANQIDSLGRPFNQLVDPIKRGTEGLGIGLALVKYIAQAHGGQLQVESKLGVGSAFMVRIPLDRPRSTLPQSG